MAFVVIVCFCVAVFCNSALFRMVDAYRELNNGFEIHVRERGEANIYRILILIIAAIVIFCSDFWWAPIIGYILGAIIGQVINKRETIAYIIFFGRILKPVALIVALICTFV